jgi:hypothetical protein
LLIATRRIHSSDSQEIKETNQGYQLKQNC